MKRDWNVIKDILCAIEENKIKEKVAEELSRML